MDTWEEHVAKREEALKRFLPKLKQGENGCIEWTAGKDKDGYGKFTDRSIQTYIKAHRWSYMFATGRELTPDICVCHKCDNPSCVAPEHLFEGSVSDNNKDKALKGRNAINVTSVVLDWDKVDLIRQSNLKGVVLAKQMGVNPSTISMIRNNKQWKDENRAKAVLYNKVREVNE